MTTEPKPHTVTDDELRLLFEGLTGAHYGVTVKAETVHAIARELLERRERDADPSRHGDASYKDSADFWHALTVELRAVNHGLMLARDKAENERDEALIELAVVRGELEKERRVLNMLKTVGSAAVDSLKEERDALRFKLDERARHDEPGEPWLLALRERLAEAIERHPMDEWIDGTFPGGLTLSNADVSNHLSLGERKLALASAEEAGSAEWIDILLCEVHELTKETGDKRIMDELLDVMTVSLRWYLAKSRKVRALNDVDAGAK